MKNLRTGLMLGLMLAAAAVSARATQSVGSVVESLQAERVRGGRSVHLTAGDEILLGDRIDTGKDGFVSLRLLDETFFEIGPGSRLVIDEFVYQPGRGGARLQANVLKGIFRLVTGKMALEKPNDMAVELPSGNLGIRGTTLTGEIQGMRSLVVLMKSASPYMSSRHVGHIVLMNASGGQMRETHIRNTGYGARIDGPGSAPSEAFRVGEREVTRLMEKLYSAKTDASGSTMAAESAFKDYVAVKSDALGMTTYRIKPAEDERRQDAAEAEEDEGAVVDVAILMQ